MYYQSQTKNSFKGNEAGGSISPNYQTKNKEEKQNSLMVCEEAGTNVSNITVKER